jgi:peptide deformylase
MIVDVLKMGNPLLLQKSVLVEKNEFGARDLLQLIENLHETQIASGGVGIAAPQIGINKQVFIIEYYQKNITRYENVGDMPLTVIINPEIKVIGNTTDIFNEGCLSVPGLKGEVERSKSIYFRYYDQYGNVHEGEDSGFFARVFQHEYDHLMGVLYPMRMNDISKLSFIDA